MKPGDRTWKLEQLLKYKKEPPKRTPAERAELRARVIRLIKKDLNN